MQRCLLRGSPPALPNLLRAASTKSPNQTVAFENQGRLMADRLIDVISTAIAAGDAETLNAIGQNSNAELVHALSMLDEGERGKLVALVDSDVAADLLEQLPGVQAQRWIEDATPEQAARIVDELPSDLQADLLREMDRDAADQLLDLMEPEEAASARQLREYSDLSAGGLMVTEFLQYPDDWTIQMVVADLQAKSDEYRDYQVQYTYVKGENNRLLGVLRLRDLLLGSRKTPLRDIMIPNPLCVTDLTELNELHGFFQQHHFLGVPVVDAESCLVGVLQRSDVDQAWIEQQDRSFLRRQGIVSGEEVRSMPLWQRSKGRLSWLSLNILLNLIAAAVISHFEDTLAAVIALAAFLPIISDMSGCSGNQAVAVSIRELMLGLAKPSDVWRVWTKEVSVGMINGLTLGILLGGIAWVWKGNAVLGAVVGVSLMLNTLLAVSIGGVIPLVLRKLGRDPAVASGPLLTTVTDMCGFFLVLSMAAAWIDHLKM